MFTHHLGLVEGSIALAGMSVRRLKDEMTLPVAPEYRTVALADTELLHSPREGLGES